MIDRSWIGRDLPSCALEVTSSRLTFFAKAIGETNPVYLDGAAARAAGYKGIPAPPTFLFAALAENGIIMNWLHSVGVDLGTVLHGEQSFIYHHPAYAGDVFTIHSKVTDIYDKKQGALEFIVTKSTVAEASGEPVADLIGTAVVRHAQAVR